MDLLDLWRGRLSWRRAAVLVSQLPPGSRLARAMGGHGAWSDIVSAIHHEGQRVVTAVLLGAGAKKHQLPDPVEPPKPGWQDEAREKAERADSKARRWVARESARLAKYT